MSETLLPTPQKSDLDLAFAVNLAAHLTGDYLITEGPSMSMGDLPAFQFVADDRIFLVTVEEVTEDYGPARVPMQDGLF